VRVGQVTFICIVKLYSSHMYSDLIRELCTIHDTSLHIRDIVSRLLLAGRAILLRKYSSVG